MNAEMIAQLYALDTWYGWIVRLLTIVLVTILLREFFLFLVNRIVDYAMQEERRSPAMSERRAQTLRALSSSLVSFLLVVAALGSALVVLNIVSAAIVLPTLGLFSAGFGLGARPLVSDYLAGITLLFEYPYGFGEKVEISGVIGTVEQVDLRTTLIRADSGELFTVPNGDVRVIRNFSRGAFSPAGVRVTVAPADLGRALAVLDGVAEAAVERYPDELIERPEVISEDGLLGQHSTLTLLVKARFHQGALLRRRLMVDVHEALRRAEISEVA